MIKTNLIDSKKLYPQSIIRNILNIIPYNNRYTKSYLSLAKLISDDYHVEEVRRIPIISNYMFYKEYGIKLDKSNDFEKIQTENLSIHTENTIYKAIMYNDKETFISFTERGGFDKDQILDSRLYPDSEKGYSLLELCCYHGAVDCFKLLRTKFNSEITETCLQFSFLGGNPEIMSECLKSQTPNKECMKYATISHNIDFVTFLLNDFNININLEYCAKFNLESFLVYFDQTNDIHRCYTYSALFEMLSLCEYFLSLRTNINISMGEYGTALHIAAMYNCKEIAEFLISHGANINEKTNKGSTPLHDAAKSNNKEIAEFLISHEKRTALHDAARYNSKEMAELLISLGLNINKKDRHENTPLHDAAWKNSKETVEFLLSHGANIKEKNNVGKTAFHLAALNNCKETVEYLLSHGPNINEKDNNGYTALRIALDDSKGEIANLLLSHGANVNEKDKNVKTVLHFAVEYYNKKTIEVLLSHGANINEKDRYGKTALQYALDYNKNDIAELLISHGANINTNIKDAPKYMLI
ncbi:ankyrin repeat protein, putative [Trichomonas vaginalis G3]|uniref:Ankyrin repeat protein, putative n=1 Tax=Trichomonas vaginalis (strain ATCC PRA-98 / G3) TaxID=412133 RepID=A2DGD2_TRIV3|nr:ankyrin repeat and SOCS box-containing protein 4 family [Trichomonas vaginalis G3]EAY20528.1 ankyrin repeat protein, putative [Trichomonas vaginalis G3]KAI5488292.1 ankyrin repeat and SOCS box-containing protein 4 family [Trichomonas vaginalis G3]|eukprot:XP_001581514.1 ankyrin repeat protein [Trichomonas vaginalis G3]